MEEQAAPKRSTKRNVPRAESNLKKVAFEVAKSWAQHPEMTLIWTDVAQFKQTIDTFDWSFFERNRAKGSRKVITSELQAINAEIDKSAELFKYYLFALYSKKSAPAHYARFGIVKVQQRYKLPVNNNKRLDALTLLLDGIAREGLSNRDYGEAYWTGVRERFIQAKNSAVASDKISAEHIKIKKEQKEMIKMTLGSLVYLIQANYPKRWKEEMRVWGF